MSDSIKVCGEGSLSNSFLGDTVQVCVVSRDWKRTVDGFVKMGIGPWRVYTFGPGTVTDQTYMGKPQEYSMRLALATSGNMLWEVIQPLEGPSIYKDFLQKHGEGVQHVAQSCQDKPFEQKLADFAAAGCPMIQSGTWQGVRYAYFGTDDKIATTVEIFDFPADFVFPEPDLWVPGPPS